MVEINLKSQSKETCLLTNQILNQPAFGYEIECVNDYNPHFYQGCSSMEAQTVRYHQGDGDLGLCSACCGYGYALNRCLGGHNSCGSYDVDQSCETQSPVWKNFYPAIDGKRISCKHVYYIDYNRFKYAKVNGIASPQDVWAIDFWFYTSTCHALITNKGGHIWNNNKDDNNNNFREFTIEWNYHIKIRVHAEKVNDDPRNALYDYYIDCTPIIVLEHQDLNSPEVISILSYK